MSLQSKAASIGKKRTTKTQFNIYIEHLNNYSVLRTGRMGPRDSPETLENLWKALTETLNACGDGPVRTTSEWKKVFTEWKSATRKKMREKKELNNNEKQLIELTGPAAVEGLGVHELGPNDDEAINDETATEENIIISVEEEDDTGAAAAETGAAGTKRKRSETHVSHEQYELYLQYLQKDIHIKFTDLCNQLNAMRGATKSVQQWQKTFWNWTYYVKKKARQIFVYRYITGGGGALFIILTQLEERLLQILGQTTVAGLHAVKELGFQEEQRPQSTRQNVTYVTKKFNKHRSRTTKVFQHAADTYVALIRDTIKEWLNLVNVLIELSQAVIRLIKLYYN